jgi:Ca2+-binding RTX toxin-like protein
MRGAEMDLSTSVGLSGISGYAIDDANDLIYFATTTGTLQVWSPLTQTFGAPIVLGGTLGEVDISPDGSYLLIAQRDVVPITTEGPWWDHEYEATLHRVSLTPTPVVEDLVFTVPGMEMGPSDVAIVGADVGLLTTDFAGSGWNPFRTFDADEPSLDMTLVTGLSSIRQSSFLIASEDNRYVFVLEANISNAPMHIYDSVIGAIVAGTDLYELGSSGFNYGQADINSTRGLAVNFSYVFDLSLNLVQDLSALVPTGSSVLTAHFSENGNHLFVALNGADDLMVFDTHSWEQVGNLDLAQSLDYFDLFHSEAMRVSGNGRFLYLATEAGFEVIDLSERFVLNLTGGAGADSLFGAIGVDTLNGGAGDDVLFGDAGADVLNGGDGVDIVSYSGSTGVTIDLSTGAASGGDAEGDFLFDIEGVTGTSYADALTGDHLDNHLRGAGGADTLTGGNGDDLLIGGGGGDNMQGGDGVDTLSYAGSNAVQIDLSSASASGGDALGDTFSSVENVIGSNQNDALTGNAGSNVLDGAGGGDTLTGASGDDTYIVDDIADTVVESVDGGIDLVRSSVSHVLRVNVENLALRGSSAINATGNALDNQIFGNSAANVIDGRNGADVMVGGEGNDIYVVDSTGDVVSELGSGGIDLVRSAVDFELGANLENLTLTGAAISATGNQLANLLIGNAEANSLNGAGGADILDGGAGVDIMQGGDGNDTYIVNASGDLISEGAGGGADTVQSSVTRTLGANLENLILTGPANLNGTGNMLANALTGNAKQNVLNGAAGNDTLNGGAGKDQLTGGAGDDKFVFTATPTAANVDRVHDFTHNRDTIQLDNAIFTKLGPNALNLAASKFWAGANAHDVSDRIIYSAATGQLFYDGNGSGAGQKALIATLEAGLTLTAGDFQVI